MKKPNSLQWKVTLVSAIMVIISCLSLSYFISTSAISYMDQIEDSAISIFPQQSEVSQNTSETLELHLDMTTIISDIQVEFWGKSLLITLIVTLITSALIYFIIGYALRPLQQLGKQIEEIQAKNLKEALVLKSNSIEIIHLTNAFNEMLQRLNSTFFAQRQFAANAAHELRTPLAVMQTKLEVFEKNTKPQIADYQEALSMVKVQTARLSQVIDVLLEMTDLQTAKKNTLIPLDVLTEEVICDLIAIAENKGIALNQKPGTSPQILGNDTLMYRAIYNLIENAIKYNHQGGEVTIAIEETNDQAKVMISDTGSGIDKNDWEKIFEPFFRVDKSRSRAMGGAGLGLALVKEIAKQHGGDVSIIQSSNQGTTIALILPKKS